MKVTGLVPRINTLGLVTIKNRGFFTETHPTSDGIKQIIESGQFRDAFLRKRVDGLIPLSTGQILKTPAKSAKPHSPDIFESTCNRESLILFLLLKPMVASDTLRIVGRVENDAFDQRHLVHVFLKHGDTIIDPTYRSFWVAHPVELGHLATKIGTLFHSERRTKLLSELAAFNEIAFKQPWCFVGDKQALINGIDQRQTNLEALLKPFRSVRSEFATRLMGPNRYLDAYLHLPASPTYIWEPNMDYTDSCNEYIASITSKKRKPFPLFPPFDLTIGGIKLDKIKPFQVGSPPLIQSPLE